MKSKGVSPLALGLTLGVLEGGAFFIWTILVGWFDLHRGFFEILTDDCFLKIEADLAGALFLLFSGFVEGFIFGALGALVFNFFSKKF